MKEYPKISCVYKRSDDGKREILNGVYAMDEFKALENHRWIGEEKIDGSNVRIGWNGYSVSIMGRTNDAGAQISTRGVNKLIDKFLGDVNEEIFEQRFGVNEAILFGELYGNGIQGNVGKKYSDDIEFILFDAYNATHDFWYSREDIEKIGEMFGVQVVPIVKVGTLHELVEYVKESPASTIGTAPMEGLVAYPEGELLTSKKERIITKIKVKDVMPPRN